MTSQGLAVFVEGLPNLVKGVPVGKWPEYVPALLKDKKPYFGFCFNPKSGAEMASGDVDQTLSLQSVSKLFHLWQFLEFYSPDDLNRILAMKSSPHAFNAVELEPNSNKPYNPMVNAGALTLVSYLIAKLGESPFDAYAGNLKALFGESPRVDRVAVAEALEAGHQNKAIVRQLESAGCLAAGVSGRAVLDFYYQGCFLEASTRTLSRATANLARNGNETLISVVEAFGMYSGSSKWKEQGGYPAKSSISGLIAMLLPGEGAAVAFAPGLDDEGNSVRASVALLEFSSLWRGLNA